MRRILREAIEDSPVAGMLKGSDSPESVDAEIDALLVQYEKESIESGKEQEDQSMMESLRNLSLEFLLEAEGDEVDPSAEPPPETAPGSKDQKTPAEKDELPPLDIEQFTSRVARLVSNASTLLPVEEVVVSRAMKYLRENYDESYVDQMHDILNNQYDFDLDGDADIVGDVPIAVGAAGKSAAG